MSSHVRKDADEGKEGSKGMYENDVGESLKEDAQDEGGRNMRCKMIGR